MPYKKCSRCLDASLYDSVHPPGLPCSSPPDGENSYHTIVSSNSESLSILSSSK